MYRFTIICLVAVAMLFLAFHSTPTSTVMAAGGGCLIGDDTGDIWVNLYQETPQGTKGRQIWNGVLFHKGYQLNINDSDVPPNLKMRYDYKNAPNDPYHGNVGFTCRNGEKIILQ
jgi:hypothetical protein